MDILNNNLISLIKNLNGSNAVLFIIEDYMNMALKIKENDFNFIQQLQKINKLPKDPNSEKCRLHKKIIKSIEEIVVDKVGCYFLQKYYILLPNPLEKYDITEAVLKNAKSLLKHKIAFSFIDFLVLSKVKKFTKSLIDIISNFIVEYCHDEISSLIIEKIILTKTDCSKIINAILKNGLTNILFHHIGHKSKLLLIFKLL